MVREGISHFMSKKVKIAFLFAQLLDNKMASGGDVLSKEILRFANKDVDFDTIPIIPKVSENAFKNFNPTVLSKNFVDNHIFNNNKVYTILILYILRIPQVFKKIKKISPSVIYTTGDFICNTAPAYFYSGKKHVVWVANVYHINPNPISRKNKSFIRNLISYLLQQVSLVLIKKRATYIFVLNKGVKSYLMSKNIHESKIIISGAGIDTHKIQSTINAQKLCKKNYLVFFGRLNETKGVFDLPEVFAQVKKKHPEIKLKLIGSYKNETREELNELFSKNNHENDIEYLGFIKNYEDVYKLLAQAKVFVFPSYEEGWGITLFECIMCETIPVVYDLSVFKEIFDDKLLYAPLGDKNVLSLNTVQVLDMSLNNYSEHVLKLKDVVKDYTWEKVYQKEKKYLYV